MAETPVTLMPSRMYPAQLRSFTNLEVPVGVYKFKVTATRESWPDVGGDIARAFFELSLDGGTTWLGGIGYTTEGGDLILEGIPITEDVIETDLQEPSNGNRMLRGEFENFENFRSQVSIVWVS